MFGKSKVHSRMLAGSGALALTLGLAGATAGAAHAAQPDSLYSCSHGLNTATTAWGTCSGSGTWRLTADCYYWSAATTSWYNQPGGTHTLYVSCPSWSHVTSEYIQTQS